MQKRTDSAVRTFNKLANTFGVVAMPRRVPNRLVQPPKLFHNVCRDWFGPSFVGFFKCQLQVMSDLVVLSVALANMALPLLEPGHRLVLVVDAFTHSHLIYCC